MATHQTGKPASPHHRALSALRRKLERAELEHLRAHCLELHLKLEAAERDLERERCYAQSADAVADMWRDQVTALEEQLHAANLAPATVPATTRDGHCGIVNVQQGQPS